MSSRRANALRALLVVALLTAPAAGALASNGASEASQPGPGLTERSAKRPLELPSVSDAIPWGQLVWGTAVVVGLICLGFWGLKKLNGGLPLNKGRYLEVLEARPVAGKVQLFLVKVGDRVVLLAATADNVTAVAEIPADELPQPAGADSRTVAGGFAVLLKKLAGATH